jgi:hypothetical protein
VLESFEEVLDRISCDEDESGDDESPVGEIVIDMAGLWRVGIKL